MIALQFDSGYRNWVDDPVPIGLFFKDAICNWLTFWSAMAGLMAGLPEKELGLAAN